MPDKRLPATEIAPLSAGNTPDIKLNSDVLPAPFGPIRPRISPALSSSVIWSATTTPPKRLHTPCRLSTLFMAASGGYALARGHQALRPQAQEQDRKSTRLKPSH